MTYVFDIDGTVCITNGSDYKNSAPIQSRINTVNDLYDEGHTIFFLTARGMGRSNNSPEEAYAALEGFTKKQLESWGIKHHSLFLGKPAGDIYIDDKGCLDKDFFNEE